MLEAALGPGRREGSCRGDAEERLEVALWCPPAAADATAVARAGAACILSLVGCADSTADNYLSDVTVVATSLADGACFVGVRGCSAPGATNFDSTATVDDGTCHMQVPMPPPPPPSPPSPEPPPAPPAPPPAPPSPPSPPPSPPPPSFPPPCVWEPQSANCMGLTLLRGISSPEVCAETCCGDPLCEVWQIGGAGQTAVEGCRYGVPSSCSQSYGYAQHGGRRYAARPPMPPGAIMPPTASNGSLVAGGEDAEGDGTGLNEGTGLDTLLFGALMGGGLLGGGLLGCALLAALRRCRRRQIQVDMQQSKRHPASGTRRVVPWHAATAATPTEQAAANAADIAIADRAIAAAAIAAALAEPTPPAVAPSKAAAPRAPKASWTAAFAKWRGKKAAASDKYAAPSPTPTPVKPPRANCTATRMSVSSAGSEGSRAPPPSVPPFQLTFQPPPAFRTAPQPPPSGCSASTAAARATAARAAAAAFPTHGGADAAASAASEAGIRARPALGSRSSSMGSSSSSLVGDGTPERITLSRRPSRDFAPRTLNLETGEEQPPRPAPLRRQSAGLGPDVLGPAFHGPDGGLSGEQMSDRIMSSSFRPNETLALSLPNFGLSAEALDNITPEVSPKPASHQPHACQRLRPRVSRLQPFVPEALRVAPLTEPLDALQVLAQLATVDFATGMPFDFAASPAPSGAASAPRPPASLMSPRVPAFVRRMLSPRDSAASAAKADTKSSPPACRFADVAGGSSADQPPSPTTPGCRRRGGAQRGPTVPQLSPLAKRTPVAQPGAPRPLNRTVSRSGLVPTAGDTPLPWQHLPVATPRGDGDLTPRALAHFGVGFGEVGAGTTVQAGPDEDEFNAQ